ncbi:peptidoglycan editing factor PgeF [Deinococcus multiflagellatus]|uniref:peptidoglycan editing factor PgeF n=1 Tax=Deinococcus multiflagellatus TaxID=1656887 RepID=UPI001CC96692|nr:peptidoglycan editing factor PgeF [Deinococcus multiflagellatus]MBZ9713852.1 peptidoglycan editing factor PgeF [Deinococcus multiflagellatus]
MTRDTERLMLLHAPHLTAPHAFSTRAGGVSRPPYAGLNLDDREDDPAHVAENRSRLCAALGFEPAQVARLTQVHGVEVVHARSGGHWTGDALVTDRPGVLLAIGTADCYPLLLEDPEAGVLGAAHAGWKGTLGGIAARTVAAMTALGARPERLRAAVGPGIGAAAYPVGEGVAADFEAAGLGGAVTRRAGTPHLDLAWANGEVLRQAGVPEANLWVSGRCSTEADFYSYRRDAGRTGRMWAVIGQPEPQPALGGQA